MVKRTYLLLMTIAVSISLIMTACDDRSCRDIALRGTPNDDAVPQEHTAAHHPEDSAALAKIHFPGREYDCQSPLNADSSNRDMCGGAADPMKKGLIRGIVYNTIVNEDGVSVRNGPTYDSDILFHVDKDTRVQIIGVSKESSLTDNYPWVKVRIKTAEWLDGTYWIFGRFVNYENGEKIEPVEMNVKEIGDELIGTYEIDGMKRAVKLRGHRHKESECYTVFYSSHAEGSHYRLVPGSYEWRPGDNILRHSSYELQYCHIHGLPAPSIIR